MEIECEICEETTEVNGEDLPDAACDDEEWTCPHCNSILAIGWFATAEVRRVIEIREKDESEPCSVCFSTNCNGECLESDFDFNN